LPIWPFWPTIVGQCGEPDGTISAKDAKYNFGELVDTARVEPVAVVKYGRPVVVVIAVEEYERLKGLEAPDPAPAGRAQKWRAKR
jgi:prevent-host-death family protein